VADIAQHSIGPQFRVAVHWKQWKNRGQWLPYSGRTDLYRLLDHVHTVGAHPFAEKPARGPLAGLVFSNHPRRSRQPSGESRTNSPL
jgi:hypothetical protein